MRFPLTLRFKFFSLTSEIFVTDPDGALALYVKQKLFKLKEDIVIYGDEQQQQLRYRIKADRVIDFSAKYHFTDANERAIGAVKRQGARSLWSARYDIFDAHDRPVLVLQEENPMLKFIEGFVAEIPVVGLVFNYLVNPSYLITHVDGRAVMRFKKMRSWLDRRFEIEEIEHVSDEARVQALLGGLMMVLLERSRG